MHQAETDRGDFLPDAFDIHRQHFGDLLVHKSLMIAQQQQDAIFRLKPGETMKQ